MELSNSERETHLSLTADNRSEWAVYSDDPVLIRRLDKIASGTPYGAGKRYVLSANQVTLRKPPRPMSEERKAQLAAQLRQSRAAQTG